MSSFRFFLTFCFFTAAAGMVRGQINAALGKPVTTQYSTSSSAATYPGDYGPAKLTDGDPATFSHPGTMAVTAGFKYDINLGRTYALDRLRVYNRNNCCPERLSNYRVSILADNGSGVPVTPALWTAVIRGNGTNSGPGGVDEILPSAHPAGTFTGQWVRIENISGAAYTTQVAEVQALTFDCGDAANLALCRPAGFYDSNHTPAATWAGYPAANLTDGSLATFSHPGTLASTAGYYYEIDLLSDTVLDRVLVYGRGDGCCPERLSNYRLALFADQQGVPGAQTWSADLHTGGTSPPAGGADVVRAGMGTGEFHGRFLRVINLSGTAYSPQIGEIEAYRPPVPVISYFTTSAGNITAAGAAGLPAGAVLSWSVAGAGTVVIDQGVGSVPAPSGTVAVTPAATRTYTLTATNSSGSSTAAVTIAVDAPQVPARLNELMAENGGSLSDEDGASPDWVEIYNPNPFTFALAGAHLTDDPLEPQKWTFPAGSSIPPQGYLVVFASGRNRAVAGSPLHTNFSLSRTGEAVFLFGPGGTERWSAIPSAYPAAAAYPEQTRDTSYGIDGTGQERFFRPATPRAANAASGYTALTGDTVFSPRRGIYAGPQQVTLTCATPGAQIRYTLDGSTPSAATGTVYTGPVSVTTTAVIRAAAFLEGAAPGPVGTHSYLLPATVSGQPTMLAAVTGNTAWGPQIPAALTDVPSISITTPNPAAINNDTEVETAFEWIHPGDPLQNLETGAGVSWFGGAFTNFAKKSFRVYFRGRYGDKRLKAPLFAGHEHGGGVIDSFDSIELRSGSHDMNQRGFYMSNLFTDQTLMEMGHLAPHGRFVHLYLNGAYWGLYHLRERWNAAMHADYLGGKKEDYEAINGNYNVGGWATPGQPFDGDGAAWEYAKAKSTQFNELRGLVDVGNYTDYMITWMFGNSEDEWRSVSPSRNAGAGSGARFILNDADGWLSVNGSNALAVWDSNDNNTARTSAWNGTVFTAGRSPGDGPGAILGAMMLTGGIDYRTFLADRIHRHLINGVLTPARNQERLDAMCRAVQRPFIAEAARWNYRLPADPPGGPENAGDWEDAWSVCRNSWMPGRTAAVLAQFRAAGLYPALNAPVFTQNGGTFAPGFPLGMSVAAGGTVHYTLDGSDPRLPGGAVAPGAMIYSLPVALLRNTVVRARTRDSLGGWSALQEAFFQSDGSSPFPPSAVVPSEIHYHPAGDGDTEFIELVNVSDGAVNLRGCRFTAGIQFAFSEFRDTLLAPGGRLVLVDSEWAHRARYGWDRAIGGIYADNLANAGERLTLVCGTVAVFDFAYQDGWSPLADGGGHSLTLIHPRAGLDLADPLNWRAGRAVDGSPAAPDAGPAFAGSTEADADQDGSPALLEYAFGTPDTDSGESPVIHFEAGSAFSFIRAAAADDAVTVPEISADFDNWSSGPAVLDVVSEAVQPDGRVKVTLQPAAGALPGATRYYDRVRVLPRP